MIIAFNPSNSEEVALALNVIARACHEAYRNWWVDITKKCSKCGGDGQTQPFVSGFARPCQHCWGTGFEPKPRNTGEMLMLIVSELAEAMEGDRKDLMDDKLPHRKMFEVELADVIIRVFDLVDARGLDIGGAYVEKMAYNLTRADHKPENRLQPGGKKY